MHKKTKSQLKKIICPVHLIVQTRGLHGPDFSDRSLPGPHGYNLGPAWPEVKKKNFGPAWKRIWSLGPRLARPEIEIEILARAWPDLKRNTKLHPGPAGQIFFRFRPRQLGLSDFKTSPFSCLHIINVFFCWWFIFPQIIKTTDLVLITFS